MKKWMLQMALVLLVGAAGLSFMPNTAAASFSLPQPVETLNPAPEVVKTPAADFSDGEFEIADQPELGRLRGGEVIVVGGLVLLVVLILVLLLIFGVLT